MRWLLLVLVSLAPILAVKTSTNDYLQPYKFVKPLADLEELYKKSSEAKETEESEDNDDAKVDLEESDDTPDVIQSRSGEAHPIGDTKALMSDEMAPPAPAKMEPETLPKAEPLKMRNRQRTSSTNRHEFRDRMSNHKLDKDTEDVEEDEQPQARQ